MDTLNKQVALLDNFKQNRYSSLESSLRLKSKERAEIGISKQSRMESLGAAKKEIDSLLADLTELIYKVQDSVTKCISAPSNSLTPEAQRFRQAHLMNFGANPRSLEVYSPYVKIQDQLRRDAELMEILQFLFSNRIPDIADIIFSKNYRPLTDNRLPNWPSILASLQTVANLQKRLITDRARWVVDSEIKRIEVLLRLVGNYLFNSNKLRYAKNSVYPPSRRFGFLPIPHSTLLENYSNNPTSISMEAFKRTLQMFGYSIEGVTGDGNCFFRAVVKSIIPSIEKGWEDRLSLSLRQRTNPGNAKKFQMEGNADQYPYRDFTIQDVNDSTVMARPGVWADHIQIQKMSDLLKVCVHIVVFDDKGLHIDHRGLLIPGCDYNIGKEFLKKSDPQESYTIGEALDLDVASIYLYFNPNPGHYEAIVPPTETKPLSDSGLPPSAFGESLPILSAQLASKPTYLRLIQAYFAILREVEDTIKQARRGSVEERVKEIQQAMAIGKTASKELESTAELQQLQLMGPVGAFLELVYQISIDEISFSDSGSVLRVGDGPLSGLHTRLINATKSLPSVYQPQYYSDPFKIREQSSNTPSLLDLFFNFNKMF